MRSKGAGNTGRINGLRRTFAVIQPVSLIHLLTNELGLPTHRPQPRL